MDPLPSHLRVGWADYGRPCDSVVKAAVAALPGPTLPPRWAWKSQVQFQDKYGTMGMILWSRAASFHLLLINGFHAIRIWTDSPRTCIVDLSQTVAAGLARTGEWTIEPVPASCKRKSAPLESRLKGVTTKEIVHIMSAIRDGYGIKLS